ncbi:thioredoxin family protein [Candidatus Halobeggiatoa sp. HSG11]|nr:thioredoxin family protein [Candidatus Halobeggiatoa sp. HSG11]
MYRIILAFLLAMNFTYAYPNTITWEEWNPAIFQQAKQEKKLVMLYLSADWCAFCKKMEQTTWQDQQVLDTIKGQFIPVKIQDETNPELAEKYRAYGRPAVVFYDENEVEILKKTGYIKPQWMYWMLSGVIQDFNPETNLK